MQDTLLLTGSCQVKRSRRQQFAQYKAKLQVCTDRQVDNNFNNMLVFRAGQPVLASGMISNFTPHQSH
jgi:hypothetical protein